MFNVMLSDDYETIKEGPVEIRFKESTKDRVKVTFIIDYGKTNLSPHEASSLMTSIVNILRATLKVKLSKCS